MGLPPPSPQELDHLHMIKAQLASLRHARALCGGGHDSDSLCCTLDQAIAARLDAVQEATPPVIRM
eukprot:10333870-Prorocentrum_lima.AAC.1